MLGAEVGIADVFAKPVLSTRAQHVVYAQLARFGPGELARLSALSADTTPTGPAGPFTATIVLAP